MKSLVLPVVGLPNVGKSTLMNALLGKKVSIVTHKKHTTRSLIFGSKEFESTQILFVDTPGFEKVNTKLGTVIFDNMKEYLKTLDEMILVLEATNPCIEKFAESIPKSIVVLNKIDRVRKPKLLPIIDQLQRLGAKAIFLISANSGDGVNDLKDYLATHSKITDVEEMEVKEPYNEDLVAFACECVREKILTQFEKEIPYKVWIEPLSHSIPKNSAWNLALKIVVPKKNYKPILLGKKGDVIKSIGIAARTEIAAKLNQPGYLSLQIVVDEDLWKKKYVYEQLGWSKP